MGVVSREASDRKPRTARRFRIERFAGEGHPHAATDITRTVDARHDRIDQAETHKMRLLITFIPNDRKAAKKSVSLVLKK